MGSPRLLLVVAALCGAQRIPELPSLPVPNEPFAVLEHVAARHDAPLGRDAPRRLHGL